MPSEQEAKPNMNYITDLIVKDSEKVNLRVTGFQKSENERASDLSR